MEEKDLVVYSSIQDDIGQQHSMGGLLYDKHKHYDMYSVAILLQLASYVDTLQ